MIGVFRGNIDELAVALSDQDKEIAKKGFLDKMAGYLGKIVLILFISSFFLFFLYLIGNFQGFLGKTQLFIINVLNISLLTGFIFSLYYFITVLIMTFYRKETYILNYVFTLLSLIFYITLYLGIKFLITILH